jgi:peptidyl-prolyl cis-trans isomerase C
MISHRPLIAVLLLGSLLALGACGKKGPDNGKVIATVNGEAITELEYNNYVAARQGEHGPFPNQEMERKVVLDEITTRMLLAQAATDQKADQEPDVFLQLKLQRENLLARAILRKYIRENPISDDEVQKRFDQMTEKADKNEYRVRHILVRTEEEAREILAQLKKGANFATLAQQKSIDVRTGKQGGKIGDWVNQDMLVAEFSRAMADLKKGQTTPEPVKTDFGWHIIKVEDSRPRKMPTFDQAKGNVRQMIQQERVDALVKSLKDKARIKISE